MDKRERAHAPLVSVVIPTYNRATLLSATLLSATLLSLAQQSYRNWEALVVDDGSTDETAKLLCRASVRDRRIDAIATQRAGSGADVARNLGVARSRGEYVVFLDSDDALAPHCLQQRVALLERHPDLDFGVFPCQLFRECPGDINLLWNVDTEEADLDRFLRLDIPWQTTSPLWRRAALERLGPWDEQLLSWQDWELHLRAIALGLRYRKFEQPDCFWRVPSADSIGSSSRSPAHLRSHEQMLARLYRRLADVGLLDATRRRLFAAIYLWIADSWLVNRSPQDAVRAWQMAFELGAIDAIEHREGVWFFKYVQRKFIGRVVRKYVDARWKRRLQSEIFQSQTFRNSPLPEPALEPAVGAS